MKLNRFIVPLVSILFLASCNSASGGGKKEKTTSAEPTSKTYQPIPSYPDLPDYGDYSGSQGIAPNHLTGITISPNGQTYCFVGDTVTIKGSISPSLSGVPENERIITYTLSNPSLGTLSQPEGTINAEVTCNEPGDLTVFAASFESRYTRELIIHILPNDGSVDFYQPDLSTTTKANKEKGKFGWDNTDDETKKGDASGDAELGSYTWHFERSKPAEISTYGGGFKFGAADAKNEGSMTFSTTFTKNVKSVVLQISSAVAIDQTYGSSTFDAWFGTDEHLARTVDGKTYPAGQECHTTRFSTSEYYSFHVVDCQNKSGQFTFQIGASIGAIYLKSILIEYSE